MCRAVVKSGRRSPSNDGHFLQIRRNRAFHGRAPGTVPEVGWFFCTREPAAITSKPPACTGPCATAYTIPSDPVSGVMSKTPPDNDRASPIELTDNVDSGPRDEKTTAIPRVTMTAPVLRTRTSVGFTRMPMRPNMPLMD